ncbi:UDP-glucuronosyl/UDP-glucosyltransferase [Sesbania bispinosa]|nr:UDP-glucuronosyl/UDP-glucosyltransferase [Sesbania bispinosa]
MKRRCEKQLHFCDCDCDHIPLGISQTNTIKTISSPEEEATTYCHITPYSSLLTSSTQRVSPSPSSTPSSTLLTLLLTLTSPSIPSQIPYPKPKPQTLDAVTLTDLINIRCPLHLKECLAMLLSQDQDHDPVACLISDAALYFTQAVCDELKLPRLVLRTGGGSSFFVFANFPLLREKGYLPVQESRLEEPVVDLPPLKVKDLPKFQSHDPEAFYKLVSRFLDVCKQSSGIIWNTFEELESSALAKMRQEFSVPIYPIGPFHKYFLLAGSTSSTSLLTPDESCISWLDTQEHKSVVYVSFGSIAAISEAEFLEIAWGKRLYCQWAPQEQVLKHPAVGSFWTHNGWNSTLESVCEGVPMICMPFFGDQKVNAKYASDVWKVGIQLQNKLERGEIEKTIRKLMLGDEAIEIRENISNLKEKANICLKEGGSSYCYLDRLVSEILSLKSSTSRPH